MKNNQHAKPTKASKQRNKFSIAHQEIAGNNRKKKGEFAKRLNKDIAALLKQGVLEDKPTLPSKGAKNSTDQWMKHPHRK